MLCAFCLYYVVKHGCYSNEDARIEGRHQDGIGSSRVSSSHSTSSLRHKEHVDNELKFHDAVDLVSNTISQHNREHELRWAQ